MTSAKPLRAVRYIRVSREDQNPSLQSDETARLIEQRGWSLVDSYVDLGFSGARDRRPELERMLAAARRREFDILICWRSDRLFRSLRNMIVTLDELAALGVGFVSATEVLDTSSNQGRLLMHLVAAFAEFERGVLIERTRAGMQAAVRRGARIGRPPVTVDVARAVYLRTQGRSMKVIANDLGVGLTTLRRALRALDASARKRGSDPSPETRMVLREI